MSKYELFISYSHSDLVWVNEFVNRLSDTGLRVVRDEIVILPGSVLVHAIEQAIRDASHGLLVFSSASVASGWVEQEYVTLMSRSIERNQLFIPVLIGTITHDALPEFSRSRYYADFRNVSEVEYDKLIKDIAAAVKAT